MSQIINNIIRNLEQTQTEITSVVENSMEEVEKLNRLQLKHGIDGTGNNINPKYSDSWGEYKKTLSSYGLDGRTPDLFLSGDFYKSIKAKYYDDGTIFIDSNVPHAIKLFGQYGTDILNLAPISRGTYTTYIYREITKSISKLWK